MITREIVVEHLERLIDQPALISMALTKPFLPRTLIQARVRIMKDIQNGEEDQKQQ